MNFELTEEQKILKDNARRFMKQNIIPLVNEREKHGTAFSKEEATSFIRQLIPLGYLVGPIPTEYGGGGLSFTDYAILEEEASYAWPSLIGMIGITMGLPLMLVNLGNEGQRNKYMAGLMSGELIGSIAVTEPDAGSDPTAIKTTVTPSGSGYILNGTKTWISNGSIADIVCVLAVTDSGKGPVGTSYLLVDKSMSPFSTRELHKLGVHCFSTAELSFEDCEIPKENLIEVPGGAYARTMSDFERSRASIAIRVVGISQAAIDTSIEYVNMRKQFGKLLGNFQLIQDMLVDMVIETECARFLSLRAYDFIDRGKRARKESSMAKAYATEAAIRTTSKAIQIHGAYGLDVDYPLERYFRDARCYTIPDGTTQIQRLIVGREVLGLRAFA